MKNTSSRAVGPLLSLIAAAALLAVHPGVSALSLGRLNVQSTLGEPLRAEIDIASLSAEEATSLRAGLASPEAFRAAGVDYNPVLAGAQATLAKRADGRAYVRLTGERAVTEPFVDVILDFSWSSGRLQRSYTLLIDPPIRAAAPAAPAAATTAPVMAPAPVMPRPVAAAPAPLPMPAPAAAPAPVRPAPTPAPAPARSPRAAVKPAVASTSDSLTVRSGDTLSSIARNHGREGVSLDQMLVSLYRGNPNAFMDNNMNRLKSGVVLELPSASAAQAVGATEARQVIQAQSADFNAFRRNLAGAAQSVPATAPSRQATGKVEAAIKDRKADAAAPTADQLKLARGSATVSESKISKDTERKAADQRVAELARNVEELKRLSGGAKTAPAPTVPPAPAPAPVAVSASVPSVTLPVAAPVVVAAPASATVAQLAPASVPEASAIAAVVASAPVAAKAASQAASRPAPPPAVAADSESFLDKLSGNPFVVPGAVGLVALLAGLGVMRLRRRRSDSPSETSFIESKLTPDSFFGVSGGQRVDTRDGAGNSSSSSLSYSLSQLDAIGDVDPVAEADVYLAYGRDLQAEEILKEALRAEPDRVPVRAKLLEVYAKRADTRTFEAQARQLQDLTNGEGDDWARVQEMGRQIDPANALYGLAGITAVDIDTSSDAPPDLQPGPDDWQPPAVVAETEKTQPFAPRSTRDDDAFDVDIDLEAASSLTGLEQTRPLTTHSVMNDLDDRLTPVEQQPVAASLVDSLPPLDLDQPPIELDLDALDDEPSPAPLPPVTGPGDFDFGDLSLDLEAPAPAAAKPEGGPETVRSGFGATDAMPDFGQDDLDMDDGDPLARKVELADEFRRIGDVEGARDLLEEVVSKAEGGLQQRAQAMLDELN